MDDIQVGGNAQVKCNKCGLSYAPAQELHECPLKDIAKEQVLDVEFETARAIHRVIRGMNDGECPSCHILSKDLVINDRLGLFCRSCNYRITNSQINQGIKLFGQVMDKNREIFEDWRENIEEEQPEDLSHWD